MYKVPPVKADAFIIGLPFDEALIPVVGPILYSARCGEESRNMREAGTDWKLLQDYDYQVSMRKLGLGLWNTFVLGGAALGLIKLLS